LLDLDNITYESLVLRGLDVVDSFEEILGVNQCETGNVPSLGAVHLLEGFLDEVEAPDHLGHSDGLGAQGTADNSLDLLASPGEGDCIVGGLVNKKDDVTCNTKSVIDFLCSRVRVSNLRSSLSNHPCQEL